MHELAIAQSIVEAVEAKASECNAAHVKTVRLKIGEASGVVTDSLTFCFEMLVSLDPTLAGAQLLIVLVQPAKPGGSGSRPRKSMYCWRTKKFVLPIGFGPLVVSLSVMVTVQNILIQFV